jgi:hypothetical protein
MGFLSASAVDRSMLLATSRVLLEEAGELYSSIIHVCIRLKSDSLAFSGKKGELERVRYLTGKAKEALLADNAIESLLLRNSWSEIRGQTGTATLGTEIAKHRSASRGALGPEADMPENEEYPELRPYVKCQSRLTT